MPINGFTVGKDVTVTIVTAGGVVQFRNFTQFESRQMTKDTSSHGMDGVVRWLYIPGGWEGSMMYDRMDGTLDNFFAQLEENYYNGQPINAITIDEVITEVDGSVNAFQYIGAQMKLQNAGRKRGDDKVEQEVSWSASKRTTLI